MNTFNEKSQELEIYDETDVLVVGGGPSGVCAAIAAKRTGAKVTLLERYNHLGGLSTGGLVIWIDRMSDWDGNLLIAGLAKEILDEIPIGNKLGPSSDKWGSKNRIENNFWKYRAASFKKIITHSPTIDPEMLKSIYLKKVLDENIDCLFHSFVVQPIKNENRIDGVIFESKEGRKALLSKVVVDASGDADVIARAGGEFECDILEKDIHHRMNTPFLLGGVDFEKWIRFRQDSNRVKIFAEKGMRSLKIFIYPEPSWRNDIALFLGPRFDDLDGLSIRDLTYSDIMSHLSSIEILNYYKSYAPGFEHSFLLQTANQTGVRHTRRIKGIKKIEKNDWETGIVQNDEIGLSPSISPIFPRLSIPLGCLIPVKLDGVIGAGRLISCDSHSHSIIREIPQCWLTGQAAGVSAAISALTEVDIRDIEAEYIQKELKNQNVKLSTN